MARSHNTASFVEVAAAARRARAESCGTAVLLRAVVEFTNVCHHNCSYCGMRAGNSGLRRYSLAPEELMGAARRAAEDGIRVIMLQGGDDLEYDIGGFAAVVEYIASQLQATALLCIGDRRLEDYERLYRAGARQAIIKFETSNALLFKSLRPHTSLDRRLRLGSEVAAMGYQLSSGFIQGLPGASASDLESDLEQLASLPLFAASVSPFIPSEQTPLRNSPYPELAAVLETIARIRLARPALLIPAVSALGILSQREHGDTSGQLRGLLAGANVLTVNYTPPSEREKYVIYGPQRWIVEREYAIEIVRRAELRPCLSEARGNPSAEGGGGSQLPRGEEVAAQGECGHEQGERREHEGAGAEPGTAAAAR
jgi:biotin synthase